MCTPINNSATARFIGVQSQLCVQMSVHAVTLGASICVLAAAPLAIIPATTKWLDQATAKQCITHAWPAANHSTMVLWCEHNGYKTQPKRYITTYAVKAY